MMLMTVTLTRLVLTVEHPVCVSVCVRIQVYYESEKLMKK